MKEAPLYERPFLTYKITGFHKADGYKLFLVWNSWLVFSKKQVFPVGSKTLGPPPFFPCGWKRIKFPKPHVLIFCTFRTAANVEGTKRKQY